MWSVLRALGAGIPCALFLAASSSVTVMAFTSSAARPERIPANTWIAGVPVGTMTSEEALDAVSRVTSAELDREIVLRHGDEAFPLSVRELGGQADVLSAVEAACAIGRRPTLLPSMRETLETAAYHRRIDLPIRFHEPTLRSAVAAVAQAIRKDPVNASADIAGGELKIQPHVVGVAPDVEATIADLLAAASDTDQMEVAFVCREALPEVLASDLEGLSLLGTFTTEFSTGQVNRATNIRVGASLVDGCVVPAGAVFSFNQTTGPRTVEKGFRLAPVYSGQQTIMGVGGGVCQLSTTVFNAARQAGMGIVERHGHSKPVHYVSWGNDATVDYGSADFRFQNSTDRPVIVRMTVNGGTLTASLLGRAEEPAAESAPEGEVAEERVAGAGSPEGSA